MGAYRLRRIVLRTGAVLALLGLGACASSADSFDDIIVPGGGEFVQIPDEIADAVDPAARATYGANTTAQTMAGPGDITFSPGSPQSLSIDYIPWGAYPLLQSAMKLTPESVTADTSTNSGGATISVVDADARLIRLTIPSLDIDVTFMNPTIDTPLSEGRKLEMWLYSGLDYHGTTFWEVTDPALDTRYISHFVIGRRTPAGDMPTSGGAEFEGNLFGHVFTPGERTSVRGSASLNVSFGTGAINGTVNNTSVGVITEPCLCNLPWNNISVSGSITPGASEFSGTTAVTSSPANPYTLGSGATGFIDGAFYGPKANELGAVWSLQDGLSTAVGTIDTRR